MASTSATTNTNAENMSEPFCDVRRSVRELYFSMENGLAAGASV